jgi:hypothetical protein
VRRSVVAFAVILCASFAMAAAIAATPAKAATGFDGTYDFTTTLNSGSYTASDFLIISNGVISDAKVDEIYTPPPNWPAGVIPSGSRGDGIYWYTFIGTVGSTGNANWNGGCWLAAGNFDYTYTGVINADGTGSGTFYGLEHGTWSVHKSSSGFGGLQISGGMAPAISAVVIAISIVAIVVASTPVKIPPAPQGFQPQVMSVPSPQYSYQPSVQSETPSSPIGPPEATDYMGGAGLSYGTSPPAGSPPFPPRDHFSKTSQEPPRCPHHHDTALVPHYFKTDGSDPGSWFCPKCSSYPWGKN